MIFDVMVRQGFNAVGKQIISVSRIRDSSLNMYLRKVQDEKKYILAVIPLFRKKENRESQYPVYMGEPHFTQVVEQARTTGLNFSNIHSVAEELDKRGM